MKIVTLITSLAMASSLGAQTRILPVDDGSIYGLAPSPNSVVRAAYVTAAGSIRGAMVFQSFATANLDTVSLAVNPYGLPVGDLTVDVYGYDGAASLIDPNDYDKGTLLGTLVVPSSIGYGQDTQLDVTSFVKSVHGSYFGFILRTNSGTDVFSSLENNYGNPCGLITVPKPPEVAPPLVAPPAVAPTITGQPASQTALSSSTVSFGVTVGGTPAPAVQWYKNGVAIAGATDQTLTLSNVTTADSGSYYIVATNSAGTSVSTTAALAIQVPSRIVNFSARAVAGAGADTIIAGFVVSGGSKPVLMRAIGPSLGSIFNLSGALADPQLTLFDNGSFMLANDNWGGSFALSGVFVSVGAFPLPPTGLDAALFLNLPPHPYSVQVTGPGNGIALAEIYDADSAEAPTGQIVNVSARAEVGSGNNVLIAGFVVNGNTSVNVLIRAAGPELASRFGLTSAMGDPQIQLFGGGGLLQQNNDWGGASALSTAFTQAGAFPFRDPASKDAALLATLAPGAYTVVVSGANGAAGVVLVEVYVLR